MNLIDAVVVEVIGKPYEAHGRFWRRVKIDAYGRISETELMFNTWDDANSVNEGYKTVI